MDELVETHAIQIDNNLATVYDFDDEDGLDSNNEVNLPTVTNNEEDFEERDNKTEGDEEVCISMLLKDDPRLTVSLYYNDFFNR